MPRKPREKSRFGIYHVILRGVNKQIIFEENEDYLQFIRILKKYKEVCEFKLYAYCLMDNHVHLLIEQTTTELETIMKRIEVKFVKWYNRKYERIGYLFQHLNRTLRNQYLQKLHYTGISIRQLSRLTGISRTAINNAIRERTI